MIEHLLLIKTTTSVHYLSKIVIFDLYGFNVFRIEIINSAIWLENKKYFISYILTISG